MYSRLLPKHRRKIKPAVDPQVSTNTEIVSFVPNAGGQKAFFDLVPFNKPQNIPYRWIYCRGGLGCVAGETLIDTDRGKVQIKTLTNKSARVKTMTGYRLATPSFVKGIDRLYRIKTLSGKEILATADHQFLAPGHHWTKLRDLSVGDKIGANDTSCDSQKLKNTKDCTDGYWKDFHRGDVLSHYLSIDDLSKQQQLYKTLFFQRNFSWFDHFYKKTLIFASLHFQSVIDDVFFQETDLKSVLFEWLSPLLNNAQLSWAYLNQAFDYLRSRRKQVFQYYAFLKFVLSLFLLRLFHVLSLSKTCVLDKLVLQDRLALFSSQFCSEFRDRQVSSFVRLTRDKLFCSLCLGHETPLTYCNHFDSNTGLFGHQNIQFYPSFKLHLNDKHTSNCTTKRVPKEVLFWDEITSIDYVRTDKFYDIHVPVENHYLAQGLWNHNSGKSTLGVAFIVSRSLLDPESRGLITANTFGQLETSTLVTLAEFCAKFGHKLEPAASTPDLTARKIAHNRYCIINDSFYCLVLSAEVFTGKTVKSKEAGRGLQIRYCLFDEGSYADESAFNTINTRLGRGNGNLSPLGVITSSINKNNPYCWSYKLFDDPDRDSELKKIHHTIPLTTSENAAYLGADYERSLRASLTAELIKIELEGEYASVATGKVFSYFNRDLHAVKSTFAERDRIYVSFDFNWSPATAIVAVEKEIDGEQVLYIHHEFYLKNANTFISSDRVAQYLSLISAADIWVFGDASGNQKTANSNLSNWQIVWNALRKYNLNAIARYPKSNPSVIDTINSCNALLSQNKLFINPACRESIKDLEFLVFKEGSDPPAIDKSDRDRSHLVDCIRYLVHGLHPIAAPPRPKSARYSY